MHIKSKITKFTYASYNITGSENSTEKLKKGVIYLIDNPMDMYNPYLAAIKANKEPKASDNEKPSTSQIDLLEYSSTPHLPKNTAVTMAYVPFQTKSVLYTDEKALSRGTLFEVLDKPFLGGRAKNE